MKVTIFIGGLSGGGAERVVCNLANYLVEKDNSVEIINMLDEQPSYELSGRVTRHILMQKKERKNSLYNLTLRMKRLKKYLQTSDTDCYLVMLPRTTMMLLALRRYTNAPIIVSERADPARYAKWKQKVLLHMCKGAYGFVFQTDDAQTWYRSVLEDKSSIVIPNAINKEFYNREYVVQERKKKIVAAGRLNEQKNFAVLINAFSLIADKFPDYKLVIYGEGTLRQELEALVNAKSLVGRVELPGYVSDMADKVSDAALFVLSSDYEGMPNALIEAMALGVPCISTDCPCGGPKFLIRHMENGILVPVGDVQETANMIEFMLADQEKAAQMGEEARKIREELSPERIYGTWENFLRDAAR